MPIRLAPFVLALAVLGCSGANGAAATRDADAATLQPSAATAAAAASVATSKGDTSAAVLTKADAGRIIGSPSASVWMIIISDFECPFCKRWHDESWDAIRKEFVETGKIRVAYVNLPLGTHKHAWPAAHAAMCASVQGKFWPVQDAIFRTQDEWSNLSDAQPFFERLAGEAGADVVALRACVKSEAMRPLIQGDEDRAARAGAQSTPTFFVGGQPMVGAQPLSAFRGAIEAALRAAKPSSP